MPKLKVSPNDLKPLLVSRKQTAHLLGCSISTVYDLEAMGRLTPIKLTGTRNSVVHHRLSQVEALAAGAETDTVTK